MKKNVLKVLATSLVLGFAGNALADLPFVIKDKNSEYIAIVEGVLKEYDDGDGGEIQKLTINRGNCALLTAIPKKLERKEIFKRYGEENVSTNTYVMEFETKCKVKDINEIQFFYHTADYGDHTVNIDMKKCTDYGRHQYYSCEPTYDEPSYD